MSSPVERGSYSLAGGSGGGSPRSQAELHRCGGGERDPLALTRLQRHGEALRDVTRHAEVAHPRRRKSAREQGVDPVDRRSVPAPEQVVSDLLRLLEAPLAEPEAAEQAFEIEAPGVQVPLAAVLDAWLEPQLGRSSCLASIACGHQVAEGPGRMLLHATGEGPLQGLLEERDPGTDAGVQQTSRSSPC